MLAQQQRINQSLMSDGIEPNDLNQIPQSYSDGFFDGQIGLKASHPENWSDWSGYSQGNREYWCQPKGIELGN